MSVPFFLNVGGVWIPLTGVARDTARTRDRGRSEWISSGGRRRVQFGPRVARSWALTYSFKDPVHVKWLAEAAGGQAGPVWLLDRAAAQLNMLDPDSTAGRFNGQPSIPTENGIMSRTFEEPDQSVDLTPFIFSRKVRAGQWYHLSGWTSISDEHLSGLGGDLGVIFIDDGVQYSILAELDVPAGTGSRPWSVTLRAPYDGDMGFTVRTAGVTTRLRLTEGSVDSMGFYPGQNTPCQVAVSDPDDVLHLYREDRPALASYTVELLEVG